MKRLNLHIDAWQRGLRSEGPGTTGADYRTNRLPLALRRQGLDPDPPAPPR